MFPVGDAWFYGLHVTKVYVSYGNMDDVRHAKSTQGVGQVQDMHGFVCSRGHPWGGYVIQAYVLYRKCMVLYAPGDTLGGPMWPNVYVLYRKCMVLYHPGTKIVDFAMENGPQRGAASQSDLGYPPFLYSNLYYLVRRSNWLGVFFGLIKGNNNIYEMY